MQSQSAPFQILSMSGGGARGLYTVKILADLEGTLAEEHDEPDYWIGKHFDLICGTSIGGILALGLASGMTARELYRKLDEERLNIFPATRKGAVAQLLRMLKQLSSGLYSSKPLEKVLDQVFGNSVIGTLKTRVLIPTVNYSRGGVQVFKTPHHNNFKRDWKVKIKDVALATSAAPTYFPIHQFNSTWYLDGGLAANSPALMGIHEARQFLDVGYSDIRLMIVGTMGLEKTADQSSNRVRGYFGWKMGRDLIDITLSANESLHNQFCAHLIDKERLLVIDENPSADQVANIALDDASEAAANTLKARASAKSQAIENAPVYRDFTNHLAVAPTFYYGPMKNVRRETA